MAREGFNEREMSEIEKMHRTHLLSASSSSPSSQNVSFAAANFFASAKFSFRKHLSHTLTTQTSTSTSKNAVSILFRRSPTVLHFFHMLKKIVA